MAARKHTLGKGFVRTRDCPHKKQKKSSKSLKNKTTAFNEACSFVMHSSCREIMSFPSVGLQSHSCIFRVYRPWKRT